jgi:hypothetical protein
MAISQSASVRLNVAVRLFRTVRRLTLVVSWRFSHEKR